MRTRKLMRLLYEAFVCNWMAEQIEAGRKAHPLVRHENHCVFLKNPGEETETTVKFVGACAIGYAALSAVTGDTVDKETEAVIERRIVQRAVIATCGVIDDLCAHGSAEHMVRSAYILISDWIITMNDRFRMTTHEIVFRLRQRASKIERWLTTLMRTEVAV